MSLIYSIWDMASPHDYLMSKLIMKKLLLFAIIAAATLPAYADLVGNGYYRVQNAFTKRYAYLLDNKGSWSVSSSTADVGALGLYSDPERIFSDPAGVFYVESAPQGNNYYDIMGQGTSIHGFMNEYVKIYADRKPYDGKNCYLISASVSGVTKYLGDQWNHPEDDEGMPSVDAKGDDRKWYFDPISADSEEYFGILPSITVEDAYYEPFFAGFPFSAYSEGMKFYYVADIDSRGGAIINEIEGTVPASTPVVVKCAQSSVSKNRLNIGGQGSGVSGNKLMGIYFDNPSVNHNNRTAFDKESMRVLGVSKNGKLAFVRGNYDYIPRNQAYLQLTDPQQYAVDEFLVLTEDQREEELGAVAVIASDATVDVYSLDGRLVKAGVARSEVRSLGKGMYLLRGEGATEKLIVR